MALTQQQIDAIRERTGIEPAPATNRAQEFLNRVRELRTARQTEGNQFEEASTVRTPQNIGQKARGFVTDVIGGEYLAEGGGLAIAAPKLQRELSDAEQRASDIDLALVNRIREKKQSGEDTSRLEQAREQLLADMKVNRDVQEDFVDTLPSNEQVIGSSARLAATAAIPTVTRGINSVIPAAQPGLLRGAARGAGVGALTGALEGAAQGAGIAAEKDASAEEIGKGALSGATTGALLGGVLGAGVGGYAGRKAKLAANETVLQNITPTSEELTPTLYKKMLAQGRISPKSTTQPARVELPKNLQETALKYRELVDKDPVRSSVNISNKIAELDDQVGRFLRQNNGIFSKGELRNYLNSSLESLDDVNVPEERVAKARELFVKNFMESIESNDMESLWIARKNFDQAIGNAFKGSPTLKKQAQVAVRDAVQNFIGERTPNTTYSDLMGDMSRLFRVRDYVGMKAGKERTLSALQKFGKDNPSLKWIAGTALGIYAFNVLQSTIGKSIGGSS